VKVYVLEAGAYHESGTIIGVYSSLLGAQHARPGNWNPVTGPARERWKTVSTRKAKDGDPENDRNSPAYSGSYMDGYAIYEFDLEGLTDTWGGDPVKAFAVAVLDGDPVAMDAVRDITRS
jgi:hypothetical protein